MIDRATLKVALLRGAALALALAAAWPLVAYLIDDSREHGRDALLGAWIGLLATPCALLEAIGRRRGGGAVVAATLGAWALASAGILALAPTLEYARQGGGAEGLEAAGRVLMREGAGLRVAFALARGALLAALTGCRAAGVGVVAQAALVVGASSLALALADWCSPVSRLFGTYAGVHGRAVAVAAPVALLVVVVAWWVDRLAWRSAPVPAHARAGALVGIGPALLLLLAPLALTYRSPEAQRAERVELAKRLLVGRYRQHALYWLRFHDPALARQHLLRSGAAGDPELVMHAFAFAWSWRLLRPLLGHPEGPVRRVAVRALARLGDPSAVDALADALWDSDRAASEAALAALVDPELEAHETVERTAYLAAVAGSERVHVRARALLTDVDPARRRQALDLLERTLRAARRAELVETRWALRRLLDDDDASDDRPRVASLLRACEARLEPD